MTAEAFRSSAAASLLAFWADAGVDAAYTEAPVDRMAEGRRRLQPAKPIAPPVQRRTEPGPKAAPDVLGAAAQAKDLAAAANDLAELEAAIAAFDGCPLKFMGANRAVFSRGAPDAPVMVVGEGPGADEDAQGAPFVGRAGKLLDKMLAAAGLTGKVFITNTVFWRPPGNRTPSPQEQAACAPFVERAIALVQPKVLLFAGGAAAKAMLKRPEGILALRGQRLSWTPEAGGLSIPAMPTLHPAFLLRQPQAKKKAWDDLLNLCDMISG
ncbi:MAG: uracil-DNA glycosylase [Caulobacteraceae bacterium]